MSRPRVYILVAALALLTAAHLAAGVVDPDSGRPGAGPGRLIIQSTPESALVVIDSAPAGVTPLTIDSIGPGRHVVVLQPGDLQSWLAEPVTDTVLVAGGEQRVLRYNLATLHRIASTPFGAEVVIGDSVIGTTPFTAGPQMAGQSLTVRKAGYEPATVQLLAGQPFLVDVPLKRVWEKETAGESYFKEGDGKGSGSTGLYITGTATLISGIAAAYFKIKADDRYQQYLDTSDRNLLSQTHRLDGAAAAAIAATQIGLGLFTYFIFTK